MDRKKGTVDHTLLILVVILLLFGLTVLLSTSAYNGQVKFSDPASYFKKQLFATVLGIAVLYLAAELDYHRLEKWGVAAYLLSLVLSTLVLFVGASINGSRRWLSLGPLSFQPSEFAKPAVILFLARVISRRENKKKGMLELFRTLILILPIVGLVGSSNLSTAVIILGIAVILVFVSSPSYLPFAGLFGAGAAFMGIFLGMESYRLERIAIWRNPESYEKGFQTIQGLYAIGSGGLFGTGLGGSIQKLGFVPEAQNDMIFSIICEELGLFGAGILLLLFLLLIWRFFLIAVHAPDLFGSLLAAGVMAHIAIQVILNVAVVTNTIPNTGITLPFVSYGGTSILFLLAEMGLVLGISRKCKGTDFS